MVAKGYNTFNEYEMWDHHPEPTEVFVNSRIDNPERTLPDEEIRLAGEVMKVMPKNKFTGSIDLDEAARLQ